MPLTSSNGLKELQRALAAGCPVLVGIQVYQQSFMLSQGGIITMPAQVSFANSNTSSPGCRAFPGQAP